MREHLGAEDKYTTKFGNVIVLTTARVNQKSSDATINLNRSLIHVLNCYILELIVNDYLEISYQICKTLC